jgi:hypothetical protein
VAAVVWVVVLFVARRFLLCTWLALSLSSGTLVDTAVYLNDENERTEDCIAIRGCYMPPPSVHGTAGSEEANEAAKRDAEIAKGKARRAAAEDEQQPAETAAAAVDQPEPTAPSDVPTGGEAPAETATEGGGGDAAAESAQEPEAGGDVQAEEAAPEPAEA